MSIQGGKITMNISNELSQSVLYRNIFQQYVEYLFNKLPTKLNNLKRSESQNDRTSAAYDTLVRNNLLTFNTYNYTNGKGYWDRLQQH